MSMRRTLAVLIAVPALLACGAPPAEEPGQSAQAHNTLTPAEQAEGWVLLFDGASTDGWRGYNQGGFPATGWEIMDGDLVVFASDGSEEGLGGDIVSEATFSDFELTFDFQVSPVGNSGIFYRVVEAEGKDMWMVAPEFQVLDDTAYIDMGTMDMNKHLTGDNYDLQSSRVTASNPIGEWNSARIVVDGNHVEHWLNGQMTVEYEIDSPEWKAQVAASKFAPHPEYARARTGRIGIQDHGHEIRYRNIKIRPLGEEIFNGRDLTGWTLHGTERWYVDGGELVCESGPDAQYGYLATEASYRDFDLTVQFKQEADGNSGVFIRSHVEGTTVSGWQAEVAPPGNNTGGIYESYGRGWLIQPDPAKDAALRMGDWNTMRVLAVGSRVTTWLNGVEMIDFTDELIGEAEGHVALQIHDGGGIKVRWRNLRISEL